MSETFFPGIPDIKYEGATSRNPLAYKYYNAEEQVMGKPMKDWLRFAVCYWHTWRGKGWDIFGPDGTIVRPWDDESGSVENAKRIVKVHFEFMQKLGVDYFCFHDRDVAPEGKTLAESNKILEEVAGEIKSEMARTGKKLLWGTANLFSNKRYMNGAATNPNPQVFAYAAAQVKKALEVTKDLGGENYVLWGGREGYACLLNTNVKQELDNLATFLRLVAEHKKKIGFTGNLLIEPKPREPTSHQYDFDSQTVIGFLKNYGLENDFKLNLEANHGTLAGHSAEHEVVMASQAGMLGSIDANQNECLLGWDTDIFPQDIRMATLIMYYVIKQGGLAPGGFNFDAKVRRESTDVEDLFIAHVMGIDTYARALRNAAKMIEEGVWDPMVEQRYAGYKDTEIGKKIASGETSLEELAKFIEENPDEPVQISGKEEKYCSLLNSYL